MGMSDFRREDTTFSDAGYFWTGKGSVSPRRCRRFVFSSVTTLRFACMVLIALRASCLSEAAQGRESFHRFTTIFTTSSMLLFPKSITISGAIPFEQSRSRVSKLLNELIMQMMPEGSGTTSG